MSDPSPDQHQGRRGFFSQAMREILTPLSGVIENKINPVLEALETIPDRAGAGSMPLGAADQPHVRPPGMDDLPLPILDAPVVDRYLRPPGALPAGEFESVCSRCHKCVDVCPPRAIKIDPAGVLAEGAPYIVPAQMPCTVCDTLACMHHCPTGALKPLDRLAIRMGTARVNHPQCLRSAGDPCQLCVEACPIPQAIFIGTGTGQVRIRQHVCIGCGICEQVCPTAPAAITVWPPQPTPHGSEEL